MDNTIPKVKLIPGLRIISINQNSPLNKVSLINLNSGQDYGSEPLLPNDIITGISTNYDKTNFDDIIKRERFSKYFIPIDSEQELYSEISKLKTNKLILGIVRKVNAGTGYYDKPDMATMSLNKQNVKNLGVVLLPNTK